MASSWHGVNVKWLFQAYVWTGITPCCWPLHVCHDMVSAMHVQLSELHAIQQSRCHLHTVLNCILHLQTFGCNTQSTAALLGMHCR